LHFDPPLGPLLDRLHAQSDAQGQELGAYFAERAREGTLDWREFDERTHQFMSDKLVALDRDKALFCHQLCRALRAREGDLRETLADVGGPVDFVLMDIWTPAASS
jgi:hypothetical protein